MGNFFRKLFSKLGRKQEGAINPKPLKQKVKKSPRQESIKVDKLSYEDRIKTNTTALNTIAKKLGKNAEERKIISGFFGERTTRKGEKVIRKYTLSSKLQTQRLQKIIVDIDKGTFNIKNFVARDERYKETKSKLGKNPTVADIIKSLDRSNFYFDNKDLILQYNKIAGKHGSEYAKGTQEGIELAEKYINYVEKNNQNLVEELGLKK